MIRLISAKQPSLLAFGAKLPCSIGRGGAVENKREGDGATPRGSWHIESCYYRADRMQPPAPWAIPIGPSDIWSDDPLDPEYNAPLRSPHPYGHEKLRRGDRLYDLILTLDHNRHPARPGNGSAIFIHRWRKPGFTTEGCIAVPPIALLWLAVRAAPGTQVLIP